MIDNKYVMEKVLIERKNGKSREMCAKYVGIPLRKITHWYHEGSQGFGKDNVYFYKSLKKIEKELEEKLKYESEIIEYDSAINVNKRIKFLNNITRGLTRKNASNSADISLSLINKWISLGNRNVSPFNLFYEDYKKARKIATDNEENNKQMVKREVLKHIKNGKCIQQAAKLIKKGKYEKTILNWYNSGRLGDKNHVKFYNDCKRYEKPLANDIFAPLSPKWEEYFKSYL